jgi:hypothetical protein
MAKKSKEQTNKEISGALWKAEVLLDAVLKDDHDREYNKVMIEGAIDLIENALSQPNFWN